STNPSGGIPAGVLSGDRLHGPIGVAPAHLAWRGDATQDRVDRGGDVSVHDHLVPIDDLDHRRERRWRLALEYGLLGTAAACLLVGERHTLDTAHEVRQRRIEHEVLE